MKTRIITAAVALVIGVALIVLGEFFPVVFLVVITLLTALMEYEYLTAEKLHKEPLIFIPCLLLAVAMPALSCTALWYLPAYIFTAVQFLILLINHKKMLIRDVMFAYTGTVIITFSMAMLVRHTCYTGNYASFYIVAALASPWLADSAAYFTGSFFGKHKLCPGISPHKTVEGALGGAVGSIAGAMLVGLAFKFIFYRNVNINFLALLIIGVAAVFISVLGDLTFSLIKRECKIKDFGSIMPGHGGMLDRFDSIIFTVPFVYFISHTMGLISPAL